MRISDWSSDVCSSDLPAVVRARVPSLTDPTRLAAVNLYATLGSYVRVAESLGVSRETARRWLHAAGVELKAKGPRPKPRPVAIDPGDAASLSDSDLELLMWRVLAEMNRRPPGLPFSLEKRRATRCVTRQKSSCYVESRERDGPAGRVKPHENGFEIGRAHF